MKKFICCGLLLLQATFLFSQTKSSAPLTRDEYLMKSKSQRIGGFILLGAGSLALISVSGGNTDLGTLGVIVVAGTASILASIPLLIAAARNKRKAKTAAVSFKMETNPVLQASVISTHYYPALTLKLRL